MGLEKEPVTCLDVVFIMQGGISAIEEQALLLSVNPAEAAALSLQALIAQVELTKLENSAANCSAANKCLDLNSDRSQCPIAYDMYLTVEQLI